VLVAFVAILFIIPFFIVALLPKRYRYDNRFFFKLLYFFYRMVLLCTFMPLRVVGCERVPTQPAIFVGNHQSSLDIPCMGILVRGAPHVWLALSFYARKPLIGFFIRRMNIPVDRDDTSNAAKALLKTINFVTEHHSHLMMFPEGTRRIDGEVHDFFDGFAMIAQKTKRPVVPVFMPTNGLIYPPEHFWMYWHPIEIIIGQPIDHQAGETAEQFKDRVKSWFDEQYRTHKGS